MSTAKLKDWRTFPDGREKYQLYLASREWAVLREAVKRRSGGMCERCKRSRSSQVHHQTYEKIYKEHIDDLLDFCRPCHEYVSGKTSRDPCDPVASYSSEPASIQPCRKPSYHPSSSPYEAIAQCMDLGVELSVDGDQLRYRAPKGIVDPQFVSDMIYFKFFIMEILLEEIESGFRIDDFAEPDDFSPGRRVLHPVYGLGRILGIEWSDSRRIARVRFIDKKKNDVRFVLEKAPLRLVEP